MENGNNAIVDQSSRLCTENLKNDDNLTSKTKSKRYSNIYFTGASFIMFFLEV